MSDREFLFNFQIKRERKEELETIKHLNEKTSKIKFYKKAYRK